MTEPAPIAEDLVLLLAALAATTQAEITGALAKAGFGDLRVSDGYLVQHLQQGPVAIGELAGRLGITAQGVSKIVIEMERKGYVSRTPSAGDQRRRLVGLTAKGWDAIYATRQARAHVNHELRAKLGPGARAFLDQVHHLAETTGALAALTERRLRP
ncbi:DNA-binding MarR family transcriptional regulator [Kibdelosporangium banguiense]|uniref:DNA-binding MarR family transcriptional regulator n=1 Tax=Kibdelosporangium banguiense TaxID=1365924 RepID=A0ABS4TP89_9PSEU|nr:MarR family winged helix-turn-helix transcriptional regulator [Kibdelosporangium banguiense]MBP2326222.1 DNA-binding MarR family transcriptional regulator [Kibdelosporangium banguiense]